MTISNPATLSSVVAEFGGPGNLAAYYRGGTYVSSNQSSTIATSAASLALSQFNGVTKISLVVSSSPSSVSGGRATAGTATTGATNAGATGAVGTVSYAWTFVSGDSGISISSTTSSSVSWSGVVSASNPNRTAVWQVKGTDSANGATSTATVGVSLAYTA